MSQFLNVSEAPRFDEAITKIVYHTYSPFVETYNPNDTIRICIHGENSALLPSQSFIYIEGTLRNEQGVPDPDVFLSNNCVAFMFYEIRYELNGVDIDYSRNVGITTSIKNYISLTPNESLSNINAGWSLKNNMTLNVFNGHFNFCVPLHMLLGFAEDYQKR
ncbi:hypothetical protein NQ317_001538 [Molorchus minor]|uniref:Double jelly roll-like domain-containing protein n=1 Tax=Molorchus minor TaxID=1323400 RepID=A0ABQ9JNX6_9CUCU|nr:hypothetical protein NQ317_001538 [Molorchus minor]